MKKVCLFFILLFIPFIVQAEDLNLAENAKSAILIEASTGEVLYKKNADERLAPASMTKIMSLILIMENIEKGNLKWNDVIVVSKNAASMGGSQIFLVELPLPRQGEQRRLADRLFHREPKADGSNKRQRDP